MGWSCLRILAMLAVALAAGVAHAVTLTGDRGLDRLQIDGEQLYEADATWRVSVSQESEAANSGVRIVGPPRGAGSPPNAVWRGGTISGVGINRTAPWDYLYHDAVPGNGACILFQGSPGFTVERLRGEWCWDGVRPDQNSTDWTVRLNWLSNQRDDTIENDRCYNGRIIRNLIEDAHTAYSARPGSETALCPHTLEISGNLISLGRHPDNREKRCYPWSECDADFNVMQSGRLWKMRGPGAGMKVLLRDNIIKMDHPPGAEAQALDLVPDGWEVQPRSGNNILIWLDTNERPGLSYETIDGCRVPTQFKVPRDLFRVKCGAEGQELWNTARAAWIRDVWLHTPPPPPTDTPPTPPTDPTDPAMEFLRKLQGDIEAFIEASEDER